MLLVGDEGFLSKIDTSGGKTVVSTPRITSAARPPETASPAPALRQTTPDDANDRQDGETDGKLGGVNPGV